MQDASATRTSEAVGGSVADLPPVVNVPTTAAFLGVAPWTVYKMIRAGDLRAVRLGRLLRIPRAAIEEFLAGGTAADG